MGRKITALFSSLYKGRWRSFFPLSEKFTLPLERLLKESNFLHS